MFDGRAVCYPDVATLRDYLAWRQADAHINNQVSHPSPRPLHLRWRRLRASPPLLPLPPFYVFRCPGCE